MFWKIICSMGNKWTIKDFLYEYCTSGDIGENEN
jgi:hypothetical protein